MVQTAAIRRLAEAPPDVLRWTLDAPLHERAVDLACGLRLQGWLLMRQAGGAAPELLMRLAGGEVSRHPLSSGRPDVIQRVLGAEPKDHPQLRCGFNVALPATAQPLELGFQLADGRAFWAVAIELREGLQVIEGRDGWLFLDNDSNRSVDQYTGALRLDPQALRQWRTYFAECRVLAARLGSRHAVVVAPSKEEVLRELYPHARAATTVIDQVRALVQPNDGFVDAGVVLAAQPDRAALFKRTDTHWTDRGAMLATLAVLDGLGHDAAVAQAVFAGDVYRVEPYTGDLGIKLLPLRKAPTEFLDAPAPEAGATIDNGLPNIGRVLVYDAPRAPFDARLLMFGASSGYPMLKYLKRLFRRVVFVHSAGNVDTDIARHEMPDALLLQSNGRFLIQPPRADFSLRQAVATKVAEAGGPLQSRIAGLVAAGPRRADDAIYLDMLKTP
jgi:hypothetical protein